MSKDQRRTGQVSASVHTERLALRPFDQDDFKAVRSYLGDPQVMRYVDDPYSDKQVKRFLSRWVGDDPPVLALVRRDKDKVVGHVVFHRYEHPDVYEISWVLHPKYHRRGYATEAALYDEFLRLMARLGMTREAALRKSTQHDGRWLDEYYYSVLDTDYADRQG